MQIYTVLKGRVFETLGLRNSELINANSRFYEGWSKCFTWDQKAKLYVLGKHYIDKQYCYSQLSNTTAANIIAWRNEKIVITNLADIFRQPMLERWLHQQVRL